MPSRAADKLVHFSARSAAVDRSSARAARDPHIDKSIALMRENLAKRWTVSALARAVGLSRPVFARRFVEQTGESPLRFLTRLRMARAVELLRTSDLALAAIGEQVGYASEFAFNRAFRRHQRVAPGGFRRQLRTGAGPVFRLAA